MVKLNMSFEELAKKAFKVEVKSKKKEDNKDTSKKDYKYLVSCSPSIVLEAVLFANIRYDINKKKKNEQKDFQLCVN